MNPLENNSQESSNPELLNSESSNPVVSSIGNSRRNFMKKSTFAVAATVALAPGVGMAGWGDDLYNWWNSSSGHSHSFKYVSSAVSTAAGHGNVWYGWVCGCNATSDFHYNSF
jgi:hypothetical protein